MSDQPDPTPDPTPTDPPAQEPADEPAEDSTDWKAEARKWEQRAKTNSSAAARLKEFEDKDKTETQRLAEERDTYKSKAELADRLDVVLDKAPGHIPLAQLKSIAKRLVGSTREELEADADELLATFGGGTKTPPPNGRPNERLRGGGEPDQEPEPDLRKIADEIPRR